MDISFCHSGNCGDIIYSLPFVKRITEIHKKKAQYWLRPNQKGRYPKYHPLKNVMLSPNYARKLTPLLEIQEYIDCVDIYDPTIEVDYMLDKFRQTGLNYSSFHLARFYHYVWPVDYDLSKPWMTVKPNQDFANKIVVNRTHRYLNSRLSYKLLSNREDVIFVGLPEEHELLKRNVLINEFHEAADFLELAEIIAGCKLFIGNQSFPFALAESLKVKRILEVCIESPNCPPHGDQAWEAVDQRTFDEAFRMALSI